MIAKTSYEDENGIGGIGNNKERGGIWCGKIVCEHHSLNINNCFPIDENKWWECFVNLFSTIHVLMPHVICFLQILNGVDEGRGEQRCIIVEKNPSSNEPDPPMEDLIVRTCGTYPHLLSSKAQSSRMKTQRSQNDQSLLHLEMMNEVYESENFGGGGGVGGGGGGVGGHVSGAARANSGGGVGGGLSRVGRLDGLTDASCAVVCARAHEEGWLHLLLGNLTLEAKWTYVRQ
eukprot:Gb_21804 [translate_table: standard]